MEDRASRAGTWCAAAGYAATVVSRWTAVHVSPTGMTRQPARCAKQRAALLTIVPSLPPRALSSPPSVRNDATMQSTAPTRLPWLRRASQRVIGMYMRVWHGLEVRGAEHIPAHGPALVLMNHTSMLDVLALMAINPYGDAAMLAKASLFRVPFIGGLIDAWGAIPVE